MKIAFRTITLLLLIQLCALVGHAQEKKTDPPKTPAPVKEKVQIVYEKVYLHLDREYYTSGDDIWFKAYLVNGQNNYLTGNSKNLYVELISPESEIIGREVLRFEKGMVGGDFKLADTIPGGKYRIRAYTKWMANFGNRLVFEKQIEVHNNKGLFSKVAEINPNNEKSDVQFFPEGGSLVAGVKTIVAFKGTDASGKGCDVKGKIYSTQGGDTAWFESMNRGMGQFQMEPIGGHKYIAEGTANGKPFKKELPAVLAKGFVMNIISRDTMFYAIISTNQETLDEYKGKDMILEGQSYGKPCYGLKMLVTKLKAPIPFPKSKFPDGIACITMYESGGQHRPHCERLVYIENKAKTVNVSVAFDKPNYKAREEVVMHVKATDAQNNPVKTSLSMAVTDAGEIPVSGSNIISYLKLESEIKGKIEQPQSYFDAADTKRNLKLDLLLLTQGWRDFLWKQVEEDTTTKIKMMMEQGFSVTGYVRKTFVNTPLPNLNVTMMLPGEKTSGLRSFKTDAQGKFYFEGLEFYGTKKLRLTATDVNAKSKGWVIMDSIRMSPLAIEKQKFYRTPEADQFANEANNRFNILRKYHLSDTILLNTVQIKSKIDKTGEALALGEQTADIGYKDYEFTITPEDYVYYDIGWFILGKKIPWATLCDTSSYICFNSFGKKVKGHYIIVSEGQSYEDHRAMEEIYNLSLNQIQKISVARRGSTTGGNSTGDANNPKDGNDMFIVKIWIKPGAFDKGDYKSINQTVMGYYQTRIFYAPQTNAVAPDLRSTIYWSSNVTTGDNGEAVVRFNNADKLSKIRAEAEGITSNGIPFVGTGEYTVK
jgi:hypothetical protein